MTPIGLIIWIAFFWMLGWHLRRYVLRLKARRAARVTPAARWAALEAEQTAAALAALTPADVEYLRAWGWTPDADVERRMTRVLLEERRRQAVEHTEKARQARDKRARERGRPTQAELAAEADRRVQSGDVLPRDLVIGGPISPGAFSHGGYVLHAELERERARARMEQYLGIHVADQEAPIRRIRRAI